jgi:cobalt-zinc-cadmium efflux system outer membrane protein
MKRRDGSLWLAFAVAWCVLTGRASAQGPTVDTSVPRLPGGGGSLLGQAPGSGGGLFPNLPGTGGILGGRPGVSTPKGIPTTISTPGVAAGPADLQMSVTAPQPAPVSSTTTVPYGTYELPAHEDDGPPDGLTLEQAIDITLEHSLDLRSKFFEIPMARADILQANLRSNPVFYQDGQLLQYKGSAFNRAAPGGPSQFDTNITYPLDVSFKRRARTEVAKRAEKVLEASYQEAVRQRIDDVYGAYVAALGARQTARYAKLSVEQLENLLVRAEQLLEKGEASRVEVIPVRIQLRTSRLGLADAISAHRKAKLALGSLMNLTPEQSFAIELKASIEVPAPPPPPVEELEALAIAERPDVISYRLGVVRSEADVKLSKANAYSDIYVLWQPYTFQDNSPYGLKSQYSWSLGVTIPVPIYNRNQGGVERAKLNVTQSSLQLREAERQARVDVQQALQEYQTARKLVTELREQVVPEAREQRDESLKLLTTGELSISDYIQAQLAFNTVVKQYLDTAVRYRLSMLSLNTAVGRRLMP